MIKTLYANGCSWAAGDGIEDDPLFGGKGSRAAIDLRKYAWPAHLGEILNARVINEAAGGGSNARILRLLVNFTRRLKPEDREHTLVVIGWTMVDRNEIRIDHRTAMNPSGWYRFNVRHPFSTFSEMLPRDIVKRMTEYQKRYIADAFDHKGAIEMFYQQLYLAQNLLQNLNIPYLFFSGPCSMDFHPDAFIAETLKDNRIIDMINTSTHAWLKEQNIPLGPSIHPLIDGHKAWAKYLAEQLVERKIIS